MILLILLLLHYSPTNEKTTSYIHDDYSSFRDEDGYVDVFDVEYVRLNIKAELDRGSIRSSPSNGIGPITSKFMEFWSQ